MTYSLPRLTPLPDMPHCQLQKGQRVTLLVAIVDDAGQEVIAAGSQGIVRTVMVTMNSCWVRFDGYSVNAYVICDHLQ